ncbi:hypothetical protein [Cellulomonas sp. Y8]|uniref:hypothetical protein n=1 Tax=Cellulomonas sp. Y8 TaxID=2591145 RepID=UPI0011C9E23B|nr:hypothetical protein [Cellulomonas sp. Y8]
MLRVYLDQNKWVDLARAAAGHPRGGQFADALTLARAGVAAGTVSFPLDMYRYWETSKRRDDRSRDDVVDTMLELSNQHTMALPFPLLDREIDLALKRRFGRPEHPRQVQEFGIGIRHIGEGRLDWPELDLSALPDGGVSLAPGLSSRLSELINQSAEEALLRAGPDAYRASGFAHSDSDHAERFVEFENKVAATIATNRLTGDAIDVAVRATDFGDIRPAVTIALGRIGMTYQEFMDGITVGELISFIDDIPTRYVTNAMRSAKHRQTQQKWEPNDFADVVALPVPAVYCDVLVTEKQWVHRMRQGKVDRRYNTKLLANTADLVDVLVAASAT